MAEITIQAGQHYQLPTPKNMVMVIPSGRQGDCCVHFSDGSSETLTKKGIDASPTMPDSIVNSKNGNLQITQIDNLDNQSMQVQYD